MVGNQFYYNIQNRRRFWWIWRFFIKLHSDDGSFAEIVSVSRVFSAISCHISTNHLLLNECWKKFVNTMKNEMFELSCLKAENFWILLQKILLKYFIWKYKKIEKIFFFHWNISKIFSFAKYIFQIIFCFNWNISKKMYSNKIVNVV